VFLAPLDEVLSEHDIVVPDLLVVLSPQSHIVSAKHVRGAPALVIEILSPGTRQRDTGLKRRLYRRVGVQEYWLVDPGARAVTICWWTEEGCRPIRRSVNPVSSPRRSCPDSHWVWMCCSAELSAL
jgi:hypothetical protein